MLWGKDYEGLRVRKQKKFTFEELLKDNEKLAAEVESLRLIFRSKV